MERKSRTDLEVINEFVQRLLQQNSLDDLCWSIAHTSSQLLGLDDCVIYLVDGDVLRQVAAFGPKNPHGRQLVNPRVVPVGDGIVGTVAKTGVGELIADITQDPRYVLDIFPGNSEIAVPLVFADNVIGVIDSESNRTDGYSQNDFEILQTFANIASSRIARALVDKEVNQSRELQTEIQHQIELLRILSGGIAHDFNNNLHAIMSSINAANTIAPDNVKSLLEIADQACEISRGLAAQLMAFAKGGQDAMVETDLKSVCRRIIEVTMTGRASTVEFEVDDDLRSLRTYPSQIERVISNLLLNADQAYPGGGVIRVKVQNSTFPDRPQRQAILIEIADRGVGINEELVEKIFDPYFTTKLTGSGLGLTSSEFIVKRHNGELDIESKVGEGTTVRLYLPCNPSTTKSDPSAASSSASLGKRNRILLVDDDEIIRKSVGAVLETLGFHVDTTGTAPRAIELYSQACSSRPYDLVILDLMLSGSGCGAVLLAEMKKISPNVLGIITSGYGHDEVIVSYEEHGFAGALAKPFNREMLRAEIERVLETQD